MEIKTKFDIMQFVYYLHESIEEKDNTYYVKREIHSGYIDSIEKRSFSCLWYKINGKARPESDVFATKEEAEYKLREIEKC